MKKSESNAIKSEIKSLKKELSTQQKTTEKSITEHRRNMKYLQLRVDHMQSQLTQFAKATNDRIAVLHGRLES